MTTDKGHRKKLVISSPFQKYPINLRETSEPHWPKPFHTVSDNPFTDRSHNE